MAKTKNVRIEVSKLKKIVELSKNTVEEELQKKTRKCWIY